MSDRTNLTAKAAKFWAKVQHGTADECWLWTGARRRAGYGRFRVQANGHGYAHRFAYELLIGPIPEGMTIDHLCRTPPCVNPAHMEVVTAAENSLRAARSAGASVPPAALVEQLQSFYDTGVRTFSTRHLRPLWEAHGLSRQWAQKHLRRLVATNALTYDPKAERYVMESRPTDAHDQGGSSC